jgi:hypothetical protein
MLREGAPLRPIFPDTTASSKLTRDYRVQFAHLPERSRQYRQFKTHWAWTARLLAQPSLDGVADTYRYISAVHGPIPFTAIKAARARASSSRERPRSFRLPLATAWARSRP